MSLICHNKFTAGTALALVSVDLFLSRGGRWAVWQENMFQIGHLLSIKKIKIIGKMVLSLGYNGEHKKTLSSLYANIICCWYILHIV